MYYTKNVIKPVGTGKSMSVESLFFVAKAPIGPERPEEP